jgi:hypothetical protein
MNTTQEIALDFAQNSVKKINEQLAVEIKRLGFSLERIRKGKDKLNRSVNINEDDKLLVTESFIISGAKIPERVIMVVKWSRKGFEIEVYSDEIAGGIKASPNFGIKKPKSKSLFSIFDKKLTKKEIQIEALANGYEKKELEDAKKEFKLRI